MRKHTIIIINILTTYLFSFCSDSKNNSRNSVDENSISIDLAMYHSGDRIFFTDFENSLKVILKNNIDSILYINYINDIDDNEALSFTIKTIDSTYVITKKVGGWEHNIQHQFTVDPAESFVFNCKLTDYSSLNGREKTLIRGDRKGVWVGLPAKEYEKAQIKVTFTMPDYIDRKWPSFFPKTIESRYYDIKIKKLQNAWTKGDEI